MGGGGRAISEKIGLQSLSLGKACESLVETCSNRGYTAVAVKPNEFRVVRTRRPRWATIAAIVLAPVAFLGLLFLLIKRTESFTVTLLSDRSGVVAYIVGSIDPKLHAELARMWREAGHAAPGNLVGASGWGQISAWEPSAARASALPTPSARTSSGAPAEFEPSRSSPSTTEPRLDRPPPPGSWDDLDSPTIVASQSIGTLPSGPVYSLLTPSGDRFRIAPGLVVGREPADDPQRPGLRKLVIADRSLSKSHVTLASDNGLLWVCDRYSTNGTTIELAGRSTPCPPGVRVPIPSGAAIRAGDVLLQIRQEAS